MAEYKGISGLDDIEIVGEAIEIDIEEQVSSNNSSTKNDATNAWRIQENAASIMNHTVSSVTAAFGKQIESLSRQSTFDHYDFSAKQETPINIMSDAKVADLNANPGSKSAASVPLQNKSSILHDKLYEKNITLRKEIDALVNDSCGSVATKLQDLLTDLSKTQLYFQESVISIQQAKANSNDILLCLDNIGETSKSSRFPRLR